MNSSQNKLPDDLIAQEILPWLPIKPLTQCKLLSKYFNSSLSSPNFILRYTKQPLVSHPGPPVEALIIQSGKSLYLYSCEHDDNVPEFHVNGDTGSLVDLNVEFNGELVGSSNGLVCLGDKRGRYFTLLNPATNQSQRYYAGDSVLLSGNRCPVFWGFGYVSSVDDYKIVRILLYFDDDEISIVHLYSLKTNSWRKIEFDIGGGLLDGGVKLANETLYWYKLQPTSTLAFHLESETFEWDPFVANPMSWGPTMEYMVGGCLSVMGGCISKSASNPQNEVIIDDLNRFGNVNPQNEVIIDVLNRFGNVVSVCFGCDLSTRPQDEFVGFTKTGNVFVATEEGMLGMLSRNSKRVLAQFGEKKRAHIHSYAPSEVSPLSSTQEPSSSTQGNWATHRVERRPLGSMTFVELN